MKHIIKRALSVGMITGIIILIAEYFNFKLRGDNYNIFVYSLIVISVAICVFLIIIIGYKIFKFLKKRNSDDLTQIIS